MKGKVKGPCPVCGAGQIISLTEIKGVPVHCNLLWSTSQESIATPKGDISLGICENCTHLYNYSFDPSRMDYEKEYENSLHHSKVFQAYAEKLAKHIVEDFGVSDKRVIEIGSGRGDFLSLVCSLGRNEGIGFDPSYLPAEDDPKNVKIVRDYYSEEHMREKADLVYARHVLEHLESPKSFLSNLRRNLENSKETLVYIEVPNGLYTLRDMGIWDLIYEHCSYFTISSLRFLLQTCGFRILEIKETYSGQFLGAFAKPSDSYVAESPVETDDILRVAREFGENYKKKVLSLGSGLEKLAASEKRTVVWGAGSKGVTFSNVMGLNRFILYLVDINPKKWGKYVAGTGQRIVSPEFLRQYQPETVILLNPVYAAEIENTLSGLGLKPEIFVG